MSDPKAKILDVIFGRWQSQILYAGVKLGIFDALGAAPKRATDVANELGLDPALSYRLLRALASLETLKEDKDQRFSLTAAGELLQKDHPQTLRGVTLLEEGPVHYALWKHLPDMVRDGRQNAFVREFGHMAFDHAVQDHDYEKVFNEAMSSYSGTQTAWALEALEACDFSKTSHLCDIGGGHGHMVSSFLARYPHLKGTVLELASVIENKDLLWATKMNVGDRCHYVAGDMFKGVPSADAYVMKMIIHDWNDEESVQILSNIYKAAPSGGRVFIIEHVVPEPDTPHFSKYFDIHMMCWGTGRERTAAEYATLIEKAGWKYAQTWFPPSKAMGAVEGVKA